MQEYIIYFSKKPREWDKKALFAQEVCKTLATWWSPIRYVWWTIYIPQLPELWTYKIVNKSLLLTPLTQYIETLQQQLTKEYNYELVSTTVATQLIELLSFLWGTLHLDKKENNDQGLLGDSNIELFHDKEYLVNKILPKLYPHIQRSLSADNIVTLEIGSVLWNKKNADWYHDFFLYVLQKYQKDQLSVYTIKEQVEIICIYLRHVFKTQIQIVWWLPGGKYMSLQPFMLHTTAHIHEKVPTKKTFKKNTKKILHEWQDNERLFNQQLLAELWYDANVYKQINEILSLGTEKKTVLQVAIDFLNISEVDFFLCQQEKKKRITMSICAKIFQEYQLYNSTSYRRWFIK